MKISNGIKNSILKKLHKNEATEERTLFVLTLITGLLAGLVAVSITKLVHVFTSFFGSNQSFTLRTFLLAGSSIFISGYITTRYFPSTSGSGIPGVRVALAVFNGKMRFFSTIAKFLTSILSLSSGMSIGREGPTVSIAAGIGSTLGQIFQMPKKKIKSLVAIGSAGGIAAAFNTPIAAVVFTLEEVVGDLNAKLLGPIIISSVIASITAAAFMGDHATFVDLYYELHDKRELFFYIIIGLISAVMGPMWVKTVMKLRELNLKLFKGHKLTIIMVTFCIMAMLSLYNSDILGSGHNTINDALLSLILDWRILLTLFVLKYIATALCYASGVSGGLFMPTLLMGAMLGGVVGSIATQLFPEVTSNTGAYALVGMGAFFVSVIRTPFTSIIMVFEMTRDYKIILPLMMANTIAYAISSKIHKGSIYECLSEQDGVHLPTREDNDVLETLIVEDAMVTPPITLSAKLTAREALKEVRNSEISGYPVLDSGKFIGMISTRDIGALCYAKRLGSAFLKDVCTKNIFTIYPDQSLMVAFHKLKKYKVSRLAVVSRIDHKEIVGIITAEDIASQFGYHIQEESKKNIIAKYEQEFEDSIKVESKEYDEAMEVIQAVEDMENKINTSKESIISDEIIEPKDGIKNIKSQDLKIKNKK